jgi:ribosomal protein S17E
MGRIRTKLIRRNAAIILSLARDKLNDNFEHNKMVVKEYILEKKVRNKVSGYITYLFRNKLVDEFLIKYRRKV